MFDIPEASPMDHAAEAAEQRWAALIARMDQATAAEYVCDQMRAELMTDGAALSEELSQLCDCPPGMWEVDEIAALMSTLDAAALGKAVVRAMAYAIVQYLVALSEEDD